ncbi:MAG: ATP-binding protein [Thermodesulfobacteriota bacterium]
MLRGLKTLTVLNIMVLILIGMLLTDFVLVSIFQKILVDLEGEKGKTAIRILTRQEKLLEYAAPGRPLSGIFPGSSRWLEDSGSSCAFLFLPDQQEKIVIGHPCPAEPELDSFAKKGMASGNEETGFSGQTWGVFWKQPQSLMIFQPILQGDRRIGGVVALFPLEGVYRSLRNSQKAVVVYVLVNILVLSGVGLYRISKIYFEPIHRLAMRAEAYTEEEIPFSVRKEDNELNQLSKSLNSMVKRISADKEKLKTTIISLEKANQELKSAQRDVIQAEKLASVGRLASGIAHEIGNPLGIVGGYLDLLGKEDILPAERTDYRERAAGELNRINAIIRQLLDFSRPSTGTPAVCSVHEVIRNVFEMLNPQPFMASITVELELLAQLDTVMADPDQLRQVLVNLCINAADAIASGNRSRNGQIIVRTENPDPESTPIRTASVLKMSIKDNGPGIESQHMGAIFDPFFTTKEPGKGTGLGLWVSFMMIEGMEGKIQAESRIGGGTTLEIMLPICRENTSVVS